MRHDHTPIPAHAPTTRCVKRSDKRVRSVNRPGRETHGEITTGRTSCYRSSRSRWASRWWYPRGSSVCPTFSRTVACRCHPVSLPRFSPHAGSESNARLTPVVTALSRSPNQTTLDPLIPPCPSACLIGSEPARGSYILICLSREVYHRGRRRRAESWCG